MGKIKSNRIGDKNINKQGLVMTVVEYRNRKDIDVQFEDGNIVSGTEYHRFKDGTIMNSNYSMHVNREGEERLNNQGLKMKIIRYRKYTDIDIIFEDNTIITNRTYDNFKTGRIMNPNYKHARALDVVGETMINSQGLKMKIITYRKSADIDVRFEDGTIVEHTSYELFKGGHIRNPNKLSPQAIDRTGDTNKNSKGLNMRIVGYRNASDIDVQFDDGVIAWHKVYSEFLKGAIAHPSHAPSKRIGDVHVKWAYQEREVDYYMCQCNKCGRRFIDTLEEVRQHKCKEE